MMVTDFRYRDFEPGLELKQQADASLKKLLPLVSEGAFIVARAEFDGFEYGCSIDVFESACSEYVFETGPDLGEVIEKAITKMKTRLPVLARKKMRAPRARETVGVSL